MKACRSCGAESVLLFTDGMCWGCEYDRAKVDGDPSKGWISMPEQPTLRDRFAMAALTGVMAAMSSEQHFKALVAAGKEMDVPTEEAIANMAYEQADAMLRKRDEEA